MADNEKQSYIDEINRLNQLVKTLTETLNNQSSTINELTAEIAALKETIKELVEQKNKNSHNSSKPPSSDGYNKPSPKSQREKTNRSKGGQKGHPGKNMSIPHGSDEVIDHHPDKCQSCPHLSECVQEKRFECTESRYVVGVEIVTTVTEHRSMSACECPLGEELSKGKFPGGRKGLCTIWGFRDRVDRSAQYIWCCQRHADTYTYWQSAWRTAFNRHGYINGIKVRQKSRSGHEEDTETHRRR